MASLYSSQQGSPLQGNRNIVSHLRQRLSQYQLQLQQQQQQQLGKPQNNKSFKDAFDHQIIVETKIENKSIKKSSPQIRHYRNLSSNVESQIVKQDDDSRQQNYFVGFEERRKQREKQIISSYFNSNNSSFTSPYLLQQTSINVSTYNGHAAVSDQNDKLKQFNNSIHMINNLTPFAELNKSMLNMKLKDNFDNDLTNKNDFKQFQKQNTPILSSIFSQNQSPIKLAPLVVQQQKKLRFENDLNQIQKEESSPYIKLQKSAFVSRNVSPLNSFHNSGIKPIISLQSNQNVQKLVQQNRQNLRRSVNPSENNSQQGYQQLQFTQNSSSMHNSTTVNSQSSLQNIIFLPDNQAYDEHVIDQQYNDINPQLYVSFCRENTLPIIDEAENANECDPHQIKLKSLYSQDFKAGIALTNGFENLSMEGSTSYIHPNINQFPANFIKKQLIGKGGFSKVYICERKLDDKILACKEVNFSIDQKAKEIYLNEIEFYQCFMRNSQVKDYFSKEPGYKLIPVMEHNEIVFNYITNVEYGYLINELVQKSLRKSLFDVRKETVAGEEMYSINLKPLYSHLVDQADNFKRFLKQIAEFMLFLQQNKWSHGDLRLDNVVISTTQIGGSEFLESFKIIDYGSSFRTHRFKSLSSHITPEYMPPEFLKHIISTKFDEEQLQADVEYDVSRFAVDPEAPSSLDIWSLGCLVLELVLAVPLWVPQRCRVKQKNLIIRGLFSTKERKIEQIYMKQNKFLKQYLQIMKTLKMNQLDPQIKTILDGCLKPNPRERITPDQILEILNPSKEEIIIQKKQEVKQLLK